MRIQVRALFQRVPYNIACLIVLNTDLQHSRRTSCKEKAPEDVCRDAEAGSAVAHKCAAKDVCTSIVSNVTDVTPAGLCKTLSMCPGDMCYECTSTGEKILAELDSLVPENESCPSSTKVSV